MTELATMSTSITQLLYAYSNEDFTVISPIVSKFSSTYFIPPYTIYFNYLLRGDMIELYKIFTGKYNFNGLDLDIEEVYDLLPADLHYYYY